jgi:hypothetical protein
MSLFATKVTEYQSWVTDEDGNGGREAVHVIKYKINGGHSGDLATIKIFLTNEIQQMPNFATRMFVVCVKFHGLIRAWDEDEEDAKTGWLNTDKLTHELDSFEDFFDRNVFDDEHDIVNCAGLDAECFDLICF